MAELAARGLTRVLCEGGPHLAASLIKAGLVDELVLMTSPLTVGTGLAAFDVATEASVAQQFRLRETLDAKPDRIEIFERIA